MQSEDRRWWVKEGKDATDALVRWIDVVRERPSAVERKKQFLLYASLYGNTPLLGFGIHNYSTLQSVNRISLNVCQNAIDSLVCKITKNRPKPTVTTVEGDYELTERAENMGRFITGAMDQSDYYPTSAAVCLDACIWGTGGIKVSAVEGDVVLDRVPPWEMIVDDREAMTGEPRNFGQRKYYDKQILLELYTKNIEDEDELKEITDAIENGGQDSNEEDFDYDDTCDQILVYEAWHLPSSRKAKDGKHIIAVRGGPPLVLEGYDEHELPIQFLRPMRAPYGFWGIGICEKLAGIQGEINRIVRCIQESMHLLAKPHWMLENSSKVLPAHLNNDVATIIRFTGNAPSVYTPQAMSPDVYAHLKWLYQSAYEITGISQLSAQGQKPPGLDSGVAMRTYLDEQTERFTDFVRSYEELAKGVAEKMVERARGIRGYSVKSIDKEGILDLEFKAVDLESYAVRVFPTSLLPDKPEGKLAFVQNLIDGFKIDPDDAFELIDWPDTAKYAKRRLASRKNVERDIALMRKGEAVVREPIGNLALAFRLVTEAYEEAKHDGVPEKNLELFRTYLTDTDDLLVEAGKPSQLPPSMQRAPEPPPPGAPPGILPGPGPANDVMPPPPLPPPPMGPPPGAPLQ